MINFILDDFAPNGNIPIAPPICDDHREEIEEIKISIDDLDLAYKKGLIEGKVRGESQERLKAASDKRQAYIFLKNSVNSLSEKKNKEEVENREILEKITKAFLLNLFCEIDDKIINSTVGRVIDKYMEVGGYSDGDIISIAGNCFGFNSIEWDGKKLEISEDKDFRNGILNISKKNQKIVLKLNRL